MRGAEVKHEFTFKEKALAFIVFILAVGLLYYNFGYKTFKNQLELYNTSPLEDEMLAEQAKATKIAQMKQVIADSRDRVTGDLSVYNNQANEIIEMGQIYDEEGDNVSISWSEPILTDTIVRRPVSISFHTGGYQRFKNILQKMSEMKYRCLITDTTIVDSEKDNNDGILNSGSMNSTISVIFFETTEGAKSLAGLTIPKEDIDLSDSEMAKRAHAYD